jgi:hypothetical protein
MGSTAFLLAVTCVELASGGPESVRVSCRQEGGSALELVMPSFGGPSSLQVLRSESRAPWVVRIEAGGSDINFWWLPLELHGQRLVTLMTTPIHTTSQDAVCVDRGDRRISVIRFISESSPGESHYAPHRYEEVSYAFRDRWPRYVEGSRRQTNEGTSRGKKPRLRWVPDAVA